MLVDQFDFHLPEELIASKPASPRDSSRLLYVKKNGLLSDHFFRDLPSILRPNDLLVFNDTSVIPARLFGKKGDSKVEALLHKKISEGVWKVFAKPAKKLKPGVIFQIADDFYADVLEKNEGEVTLRFNVKDDAEFYKKLNIYGVPPLPPYINRKDGIKEDDVKNYQTIYAKNKGAVAAPTAGLHFTDEVLEKLDNANIKKAFVTLHVGAGTFLPVKVDDTKDHKMHSEVGVLDSNTADLINETKKSGGRVIAVGTTSLRLLESAANDDGFVVPFSSETNIFITPGYKFKIIDAMITNFHIPKSTLFMLISAFAGLENMKAAYDYAIDKKYRFYSYGDACFIE